MFFNDFFNKIGEKLNDEDLHEILEEADRDGDGMISFEEFYRFFIDFWRIFNEIY